MKIELRKIKIKDLIKDLINQADENMYEFKKNKTKKVIREA